MIRRGPKPRQTANQHKRHYLKEWREYLNITQDRALERLSWSQSKLSRIENRRIPLTLDDLEAVSHAYGISAFHLQNVNPFKEGDVIDMLPLLEQADPDQRREIARFAEFVIRRGNGTQ